MKPKEQTPTRQQPFKKGCVGIGESSTHGLRSRTTFADVNKINFKLSECSASVLNLKMCVFTHCFLLAE